MKAFLLFLLLAVSIVCKAQTEEEDVDFILGDFVIEQYGEYEVREAGMWGLKDGGTTRSVKFKEIYTLSNSRRAVVLIYQKFVGNSLEN